MLAGAALLAFAALGRVGASAGYVWSDRLLDHPIILGGAGLVLGTIGAARALPGLARAAAIVAGTAVVVVWCGWFTLQGAFSPSPWQQGRAANRDGTLESEVLLAGIVDPIYVIRVEQTDRGPWSRSFLAGCIDGDALSLTGLRWQGSELIADTSAGSIAIAVGPDGRPGTWRTVDPTVDEGAVGPVTLDAC